MGVSEFMLLKLCVNLLKWKRFKTLGHEMVMANWHLFLKGILFFCLSFHNILANRYEEDVGHISITRQVNATLTGVFIFFGKLICLSLLSSLRAIPQSTRFLFIIFFFVALAEIGSETSFSSSSICMRCFVCKLCKPQFIFTLWRDVLATLITYESHSQI